jgi:hypothetical protein
MHVHILVTSHSLRRNMSRLCFTPSGILIPQLPRRFLGTAAVFFGILVKIHSIFREMTYAPWAMLQCKKSGCEQFEIKLTSVL